MKSTRVVVLSVVLFIIVFCMYNLYMLEKQRRTTKADLVELSKIKYGALNVDEWKIIISHIITEKINEIDFEPKQKEELRAKISTFLYNTIDQFREHFYDEKNKTLFGLIQGGITSLTGMFEKIKKEVPFFTDEIMEFLNNTDNKEQAKAFILEKFTDYTDKTFSKMDYMEHDKIILHYGYGDRKGTIEGLKGELDSIQRRTLFFLIAVLVLNVGICFWLAFSKTLYNHELAIIVVVALCFLWAGIFLPMIEIDARLDSIKFRLLGDDVNFSDQVLYYRSKSIIQVVRLLLFQGKIDIAIVGALVLIFSVLFPLGKLSATATYMAKPSWQEKKWLRFMVFKLGKWSMADVMVVAIFMAYLGFSGILTEQLKNIEQIATSIDIMTTNKSSIEIGFPLFTSFVLLGLMMSYRLENRQNPDKKPKASRAKAHH